MPKNCAKCRAENVVQAKECASCGAKFGKGLPGTEPPSGGRQSGLGCLGWVIVVVLVGWAATWIYGKVTDDSGSGTGEQVSVGSLPADDVEMSTCRRNEYGRGDVWVIITNNTTYRADYFVTVALESSDGTRRHGDAIGSSMNLDPGQKSRIKLASVDPFPAGKCRLLEVQRAPS